MKLAIAAAVAIAAGLGLATPADADQYDYVSELDNNGIYYSSISEVIDLGKQVCTVGRTAPTDILQVAMGTLLRRAGYTSSNEGNIIVSAAATNMCPDIYPRIREAVGATNAG